MNKVYRSVWNESTRTWVAAEESARGKTKGGVKRSRGAVAAAAVVVAATFSVWAPAALADSQVEMGVDSVAENAAVDTRLSSGSSENDMRSAFELADEEEVRKRARQAQQKQLLMASLNPAGPSRGAAPVGMADNVKEPFVKETMLTQAELIDMMQRQKSSSQLGKDVVVWGDSVAIGDSANAMIGAGMGTDQDGTAIGHASKTGYEGSALGFGTTALGKKSAAVGKYANATGENAVAIGSNGIAKDDNSIVLGAESVAEDEKYRGGERVLSLGKKDNSLKTRVLHVADAMDDTDAATYGQVKSELAKRLDDQSVFFGKSAKATGARTTSIGVDSTASGQSAIAIGDSARANGIGAIAIGRGSIANKDETVSFGFQKGDKLSGTEGGLTAGITQTRELVNVSQGTQDHSVVTLSQLKKLAAEISEDIKFDDNGNSTDVVYKSQSGSHASLRGAVENINGVVTANKQAIANATQALADKVTKAQLTQAQETIKAELKQIAGENTSGQIMITSSDKNHKAEVGKNSDNSIAIGSDAKVLDNSDYAMALGAQSKAKGQGAMVQGASARAEGIGALATGFEAKAIGDGALAFGNGAKAYVEDANNKDENDLPVLNPVKSATAIGQNAHAAAEQALAIGMEAKALQAGSVAIGANSTTARANTFAVGGTGVDQQRQVVNVAAGTLANDATNVEQIKKLVGAKDLTFKANGDIEKLTLDESNKQSLAGQLGAGTSGAIATKGSKGAARADGINSVAVGAGSVALAVNEFSVGSGSIKRIVRNVANAQDDFDAVNKIQLDQAVGRTVSEMEGVKGQVAELQAELMQYEGPTDQNPYIQVSEGGDPAKIAASSSYAIALGSEAEVLDKSDYAMALGAQAKAKGQGAMVQGASARAEGLGALATGYEAKAIGDGALAFGNGAKAYVADPSSTDENGKPVLNPVKSATAIGQNAHAAAEQALAIGMEAKALQAGSVAIGANSTTARANTFAVGGTGVDQQRQVVNVAAGTLANDATNVEQIKQLVGAKELTFDTNGKVQTLTLDASKENSLAKLLAKGKDGGGITVVKDSNGGDKVETIKIADGQGGDTMDMGKRKLTNVMNATVSTDAVALGQLTGALGVEELGTDGTLTNVQLDAKDSDTKYTSVADGLGKTYAKAKAAHAAATAAQASILVKEGEKDGAKTLTVAAGSDSQILDVSGKGNAERRVTGVANAVDNIDAVAFGQLKGALGVDKLGEDGKLTGMKLSDEGAGYTTVAEGLRNTYAKAAAAEAAANAANQSILVKDGEVKGTTKLTVAADSTTNILDVSGAGTQDERIGRRVTGVANAVDTNDAVAYGQLKNALGVAAYDGLGKFTGMQLDANDADTGYKTVSEGLEKAYKVAKSAKNDVAEALTSTVKEVADENGGKLTLGGGSESTVLDVSGKGAKKRKVTGVESGTAMGDAVEYSQLTGALGVEALGTNGTLTNAQLDAKDSGTNYTSVADGLGKTYATAKAAQAAATAAQDAILVKDGETKGVKKLTVAAGSDTKILDVSGKGNAERRVTGVANATATRDAMNLGQVSAALGVSNIDATGKLVGAVLKSDPKNKDDKGTPYSTVHEGVQLAYAEAAAAKVAAGKAGDLIAVKGAKLVPARATGINSVAVGAGSVALAVNEFSVGSGSIKRIVRNVANAQDDFDAVNKIQLDQAVGRTVSEMEGVKGQVAELQAELMQYEGPTDQNPYIQVSEGGDPAKIAASSNYAIAVGSEAEVLDKSDYAMALGAQAKAKGQGAMVQGASARAEGLGALATGYEAKAIGDGALAFGNGAKAYVADPSSTDENGKPVLNPVKSATAIGQNAHAAAEQALAIGMEAKALQAGSVAIGANSTTARANTFAVGGTGLNQQRQVVNVAAGTLANDATNVEQIKQLVGATELTFDTNGQIQKLTLDASKENSLAKLLAKGKADNGGNTSVDDSNAVKYTDEYTVTLNADTTKPDAPVYTKLTNVANGAVEENSVDAVNGHQLNEVKQTAQANSTALAHTVKADDFNQFKVDLGKNLLAVAETDGLKTVTVGAQLEGGVMSIAGMSGARQLTGVAMGGGDDNAVNVEQLKNVLGGEAQFNADGTLKSFKPEGAKKAFGNLSEAFKASLDAKVGGDDGETGTNVGADPLAVSYANADKAEIQLQGANGTTITNVADGSLDPASLDAVNGRQLGKVAAEVELQADAIKGIDEEVKTQAMSIAALDINVRENTGAILENTTAIEQLSSGQAGLVTAEAGGALQVGAAMGGNAVNIAGTDGARKLTGLANGEGETDAVTFAQLKAYTQDADGKATFPTVKYDDGNLKMVTFGGTGGTVLNGVAAGEIAAGSQQAVNGGQLFTYQQEIKQFAEAVGAVVNDHQDRLSDLDRAVRQVGERPVTSGNLAELTGGEANGEGSVALGKNSRAQREDGGAVKNAVAFGDNSNASADNSTAIGTNARSTAKNAVALGQDSVADREDTVSVGSEGHERQISHVASAKAGTDAVNLDQLNASVADGVQQSNNYTDQRIGGVQSQLNDVAKNAYSGIAAATALTMIPDVDMGKTLSFGIGASTFKGYKAVALGGTARIHDNIKVKAGVGLSSGGSTVGVGASYQW